VEVCVSINARNYGALSARRKEGFIMEIRTINDSSWLGLGDFLCVTGSFRNVVTLTR
jgi:hypothetical protein